jgi:hypothetical protein
MTDGLIHSTVVRSHQETTYTCSMREHTRKVFIVALENRIGKVSFVTFEIEASSEWRQTHDKW